MKRGFLLSEEFPKKTMFVEEKVVTNRLTGEETRSQKYGCSVTLQEPAEISSQSQPSDQDSPLKMYTNGSVIEESDNFNVSKVKLDELGATMTHVQTASPGGSFDIKIVDGVVYMYAPDGSLVE